jgi:hypothetical protein
MTTPQDQSQPLGSDRRPPSTTGRSCAFEMGIEGRKPYTKPAIVHELELEVRAGTPLVIDPLDPLGLLGQELDE